MKRAVNGPISFLFTLVVLMSIQALTNAKRFDLRIDDVSGRTESWPVVGGLPFADGELRDADSIRIVSDDKEVPAQIDVAARWRDGSIRWALASFNAAPGSNYACEYGSDVKRSIPEKVLTVTSKDDGTTTVDTGAAVYEFVPNKLLPERAWMGTTIFLDKSGDGAYLVDNQGRTARVAGARSDVTSEIVKNGPMRTVIRREGWYVTENGDRLARGRVWLSFFVGKPFMKLTHSLILTEDTNKLWIRDYGLTFRTGKAPKKVVFAVADEKPENLLATRPVKADELVTVEPNGGIAFMLQDRYPQFLERDTRALVARLSNEREKTDPANKNNFWTVDWKREATAAGDWGDGSYEDFGLTLATPWLAQQFPTEIAFGPDGATVAFWSSRCGRSLDFRTTTLINESWRSWSSKANTSVAKLAETPSNAQGMAPTRDAWLSPRTPGFDERMVKARATAVSRPPLLQADPVYLTATEAIGWPMHPKDEKRFPKEEAALSDFWDQLMERYENLRRTGVIDFGGTPLLHGAGSKFFRLTRLSDYGLRRHVWGLYGRSGERRYLEYGTRFNRFASNWKVTQWTAGDKIKGAVPIGGKYTPPLHWENFEPSKIDKYNTLKVTLNWLLEYYFTGNEHALEMVRVLAEGCRHWDVEGILRDKKAIFGRLNAPIAFYIMNWDQDIGDLIRPLGDASIDLNIPVGLNDDTKLGAMYKMDRILLMLYDYYWATGDENAKKAIIQNLNYQYRFKAFRGAYGGQSYASFLFAIAYMWTGNPNFLRLVEYMTEQHRRGPARVVSIHSQKNLTMGLPTALKILAEAKGPITPFPVVDQFRQPGPTMILFRKPAGKSVKLGALIQLERHDLKPKVVVSPLNPSGESVPIKGVEVRSEQAFQDYNAPPTVLSDWHLDVTVPKAVPGGLYRLDFPRTNRVIVLDSTAPQNSVVAPNGYKITETNVPFFFPVGKDLDTLRISIDRPMEVRRPDGTVAVEASEESIGDLSIPVEGKTGAWSVMTQAPGVVTVLNAAPLFSRSPKWLVTGSGVKPKAIFTPPSKDTAFVPGKTGQALHLPGGKTLRFSRGTKNGDAYERFPTNEGTIEFWFRPNWSSSQLRFSMGKFNDHTFIQGGSCDLHYRRGQRRQTARPVDCLNLWLWSNRKKGKTDFRSGTGSAGRFWFEAGEWYHVAAVWKLENVDGKAKGEFAVYVNGKRLKEENRHRRAGVPPELNEDEPFSLKETDEWIQIGPLDGTIAGLRISDVVRYEKDFNPTERLADVDDDTLVLFPFDGSYDGVDGSGKSVELKK